MQSSQSRYTLIILAVLIPALAPQGNAASNYRVLHAFGNGSDGAGVFGGVAVGVAGDIYGTTSGGGAYGAGTAWELTPTSGSGWTEAILHSFCRPQHCTDGAVPMTTPTLDAAGNLYGSTNSTIFRLQRVSGGWHFSVIYEFLSVQGLLPDAAGNLYGSFSHGRYDDGAVSELSRGPFGWREKDLYSFYCGSQCGGGGFPAYRLTWDAVGNLYGVTTYGGAHNWGVAYQLQHTAGGWKEHVLYDFPSYAPGSSLTFDSAGNLYGTTFQEGPCDGTVYQLSPQGESRWKRTILYPFCNPEQNGGAPDEPVTFDPRTGILYGTATAGGDPQSQCGVIFKLSPGANGKWKYTVLYKFHGPDGAGPNGLTIDSKGNLYGSTVAGGTYNAGVAFEMTP
jgi:uncharacterized repeat protein (TIGR03803 family)